MDLLGSKGFYPYEWVDNDSKLNHEVLPDIKDFYSSLKNESLTEENYDHAKNVYEQLNCKTYKDYHMTYLECDVLLLADVFEHFRNNL